MLRAKVFVYLLALLFLVSFVNAATIYGTVYDLSLKKINNARVEINTNPKQFLIAQNGTYSFNAPNGFYTIKAQLMQKNEVIASVQENITIVQDGNYVFDLILFPDIEEGIEDPGIDVNGRVIEETDANDGILLIVFIILFISGIIVGVFYFLKIRKKENVSEDKENSKAGEKSEDEELDNLIKIIKREGGRTTQKEIRKQIPLSEAKISLMIAELEHKGIVEKIKKGRGNIIILKKK
ncbi:hypothetical protein HY637_05010 [Candidatus Woesearchaeota archaeon]|nr:hypothetical protein [Candidatus Woesearchaeota archaeon]